MEVHSEIHQINQDVSHLWTRFEGLVGNQLYRLRADGTPAPPPTYSNTLGVSSNGCMPAASCSSSVCSLIISTDGSNISINSSPACLQKNERGLSLGSDGCGEGDKGNYASQRRGTSVDIGVVRNGGGENDIRMRETTDEDGDADEDVDVGDEANDGCRDRSMTGTSTSCCLLPGEESCSGQSHQGDRGQLMRRNASSNALNNSDTQPLFGLPYVARAAGPLLSLTTVTLEEWSGEEGPRSENSLVKLHARRKESGRSMLGVYKQSLVLESQLHQYLNPGLVTSLNRRVARATFEAEAMVSLIDKLRKESKKAVTDAERNKNVVEVSTKLKSLLGRQKCEWQCVGRLKETLTMAREMKELLKFIARLSNLLEKNKLSLGSMQDRPPPYEYCSPYVEPPKTGWPGGESQLMLESSNQSNASPCGDGVSPKDLGQGDDKASVSLSSKGSESNPEHEGGNEVQHSPSPMKFSRAPKQERYSASDSELDSYDSGNHSNKRPCSTDKAGLGSNTNVSKSIDQTYIKSEYGKPPQWLTNPIVNTVMDAPRPQSETLFMRNSTFSLSGANNVQLMSNSIHGSRCSQYPPCPRAGGECPWRSGMNHSSPPRACPQKRNIGECNRHCYSPPKRYSCSPHPKTSSCGRRQNSPRWDGGSSRMRRKFGDSVGDYADDDSEPAYSTADETSNAGTSRADTIDVASRKASSNRGSILKGDRESVGKGTPSGKDSISERDSPSIKSASGKDTTYSELSHNDNASVEKSAVQGNAKDNSTSQSALGGTLSTSKGGSTATSQSKKGNSKGSGKGDDKRSKGGDLSGSSDESGDILIDIQQDYPSKTETPLASVPSGGNRRIRVRVKRSSSETSKQKRSTSKLSVRRSPSRSPSRSPGASRSRSLSPSRAGSASRLGSPKKSTSQDLAEVADSLGSRTVTGAEDDVMSNKESYRGATESQLNAQPSNPGSKMSRVGSKMASGTPSVAGEAASISEGNEGGEDGGPQDWQSKICNWLREKGIPGVDYIEAILRDPQKLALVALVILLLLFQLFQWLFGGCCGCGYLPNPFFYFTNKLAGRVTLKHGGLAPT